MDLELLDTWILTDPNSHYPAVVVPNTVHFEKQRIRFPGGPIDVYSVTQFACASELYRPNSTQLAPVCVIRSTDVDRVRELWQRFTVRGWVRVPPATPMECDCATIALRARSYRTIIAKDSVEVDGVVYKGEFTDNTAAIDSDSSSSLYFSQDFHLKDTVIPHPVTGMPMKSIVHELLRKTHEFDRGTFTHVV